MDANGTFMSCQWEIWFLYIKINECQWRNYPIPLGKSGHVSGTPGKCQWEILTSPHLKLGKL